MNELILPFAIVGGLITLIGLINSIIQKNKIGEIKCNKCGHVGKPMVTGLVQGSKTVCHKCKGEDWVKS